MRPIIFHRERYALFDWLCQERYRIKLRKEAGDPRPWTEDAILDHYHFCHVHREDDTTSLILHELARREEPGSLDHLKLCVMGRVVNHGPTVKVAWPLYKQGFPLIDTLEKFTLNTIVYKLHTPLGLFNREGMVMMVDVVDAALHAKVAAAAGLEAAVKSLRTMHSIGPFNGYQIALDLYQTNFWRSPDFAANWTHPGPGAARGAVWLSGDDIDYSWTITKRDNEGLAQFQPDRLLHYRDWLHKYIDRLNVRMAATWPKDWQPLTVHEIEFMLCEYDKYLRKKSGVKHGRKYQPGRNA